MAGTGKVGVGGRLVVSGVGEMYGAACSAE